jgi:hypothetical protein
MGSPVSAALHSSRQNKTAASGGQPITNKSKQDLHKLYINKYTYSFTVLNASA